ncbi:hypothetical protein BOX15_Mlig002146g35 [Macrostomum lignano]|uniref:Uncharacterized protein n=1 Tax=Macrostomum lignano TaxID=282301 RepID=A0A267DIV3_9PLAT|nr:hypothetical protein BOX15_Mlig002146g35 [Macrostomum lignano]
MCNESLSETPGSDYRLEVLWSMVHLTYRTTRTDFSVCLDSGSQSRRESLVQKMLQFVRMQSEQIPRK